MIGFRLVLTASLDCIYLVTVFELLSQVALWARSASTQMSGAWQQSEAILEPEFIRADLQNGQDKACKYILSASSCMYSVSAWSLIQDLPTSSTTSHNSRYLRRAQTFLNTN